MRDAIARVETWAAATGEKVEGLHIELAAGLIGVTAAINEVVWATNLKVVPAVLALIFVAILLAYRSWHAAWIILLSMSFSTLLTYTYMALQRIGININTVPMIAVGIGVGIDYSIYMLDRIREEMRTGGELRDAVARAMSTTGFAITMTFTTLIGGIAMWFILSDLRFQADAALLLAVMLALNALGHPAGACVGTGHSAALRSDRGAGGMNDAVTPEHLRQACGRFATGVTAICARDARGPTA